MKMVMSGLVLMVATPGEDITEIHSTVHIYYDSKLVLCYVQPVFEWISRNHSDGLPSK